MSVFEPVVDQTLVAALSERHQHSDAEKTSLTAAQIKELLSGDAKAAKGAMRTHNFGAAREERRALWEGMYARMAGETELEANRGLYQHEAETNFGEEASTSSPDIPSCLDPSHSSNTYCLKASGKASVLRIITCLQSNDPLMVYAPVLHSLAAVFRHYMTEEDTFGVLKCLLSQDDYISQSEKKFSKELATVGDLQRKFNAKALQTLRSDADANEVDLLISNSFWCVLDHLPLPHMCRIIDCYLTEGCKIFYRASLSLVKTFSKEMKKYKSDIKSIGLLKAFIKFTKEIPISPQFLLDRGFNIKHFSRNDIKEISSKVTAAAADSNGGAANRRGVLEADAMGNIKEQSNTMNAQTATPSTRKRTTDVYPVQEIAKKSQIMKIQGFKTLWSWLPEHYSFWKPEFGYSTDEHGISMTTFYARAEKYETTFIIVKTTKGEIFGAFCDGCWQDRGKMSESGERQTYFGGGYTFLFTVSGDDKVTKFEWVDLNKKGGGEGAGDAGLSKAEKHQRELFITGKHDFFAVGGGAGNGLFIDSTLTHGRTEKCATFDNPPLCSTQDFEVALIEVIGLNPE